MTYTYFSRCFGKRTRYTLASWNGATSIVDKNKFCLRLWNTFEQKNKEMFTIKVMECITIGSIKLVKFRVVVYLMAEVNQWVSGGFSMLFIK